MIIKQKIIQQILRINCDKCGIKKASKIINEGGIVVFPTDTVYGIGCDPYNTNAIKKIYEIKSREISKPFPVLTYSRQLAEQIAHFDKITREIADRFWPGPLTMIVRVTDNKLRESLGLNNKIAIRIPDHRCTLDLLEKCNFIIGTSANISGEISFTNPDECFNSIKDYDVFIDGGIITSKGESTIIEVVNDEIKIIREGSLSKEILDL